MPIYEYRCKDCGGTTSKRTRIADKPKSVRCEHCESENTQSIVSRPSVVLSSQSKVDRLDPKYDKIVDHAMKQNPLADPDRLLKKMRDPGSGTSDP